MDYTELMAYYSSGDTTMTTIISIVLSVFLIVTLWFIFKKAGEPGWAAIIPFYSAYVLFKITWGKGWYFLLMLIPIANIVFWIMAMVKLAKAFGKSGGFAVGLILLNAIFMGILAFGGAKYLGVPEKQA